jgi:putative MATE family efflux protein
MKDLTHGSLPNHIVVLAAPLALGMLAQVLEQAVSLYFVTKLGIAATAGVNLATNILLIIITTTQVLNASTAALVAHAAGRYDRVEASLIFTQSLVIALLCGGVSAVLLYTLSGPYFRSFAADAATIEAGTAFVYWATPGIALMFTSSVLGAGLRGIGVVRPVAIIQVATVGLSAILTPIFVLGWGTDRSLGVRGAGLATSVSTAVGVLTLAVYLHRAERLLQVTRELIKPRPAEWRRILGLGLPAGAEVALTFLSSSVVYYAIRDFGAAAQAGYGIGWRVVQIVVLPAMAIAYAIGPIAGQNFGAGKATRVKHAFRCGLFISTALALVTTILVQWRPSTLVSFFDTDPATIVVAALFLQIRSWSFVPQGVIFSCSVVFQSLGNSVPGLICSAGRFVMFAACVLWLSHQPLFRMEQLWYAWVASMVLQALASLWFLPSQFRRSMGAPIG